MFRFVQWKNVKRDKEIRNTFLERFRRDSSNVFGLTARNNSTLSMIQNQKNQFTQKYNYQITTLIIPSKHLFQNLIKNTHTLTSPPILKAILHTRYMAHQSIQQFLKEQSGSECGFTTCVRSFAGEVVGVEDCVYEGGFGSGGGTVDQD